MGLAVRWVHEHIAAQDGDQKRVFLMGPSAGGTHVASYVAQERFHQVQLFPAHSHMSEIYSIHTDDRSVGVAMLSFIQRR